MLASFPAPVLSVTIDAVKDLEGGEALSGLWTLFTKCKESLKDGHRLENISWRLWYRELASANSYRPPTPDSDSTTHPSFLSRSNPAVKGRKDSHSPTLPLTATSSPFSKFICDIIPNTIQIKPTVLATPKQQLVSSPDKPNTDHIPSLPTPTVEHSLSLPSQVNPDFYLSPGFPHVVISHPTPPPTPILGDQKSTNPSTTLSVSPSLVNCNPSLVPKQRHIVEPAPDSSGSRSPEPEPMVTAEYRPRGNDEPSKPADRRFFLQQSPDGESPERPEDASPTKTTSELAGSVNSTQIKSGPSPTRHHMPTVTKVRGRGKEPVKHVHARRPNLAHRRSHHGVPTAMVQPGDRSKVAFNMEPVSPAGSKPAVMKSQATRAKGGNEPSRKPPPPEAKANDAAPTSNTTASSKQTLKIVMASTSSDSYETESDSDDGDDSWVSDEVTRVPSKPSNKALDMRRTRSQPAVAVAEARRAKEVELEAKRARDLFAKMPKRTYANNLARNRTQSGMLTQLLNPDPMRFPELHPYRLQRTQSQGGQTAFGTHDLRGLQLQYIQPPRITKSTAAAPVAAQVNTPGILCESQKANGAEGRPNGAHRPKGRPQDMDVDSDSGSDDPSNSVQLSKSIAHQRLEALVSRHAQSTRGQPSNGNTSKQPPSPLQPLLQQQPVAPIPLSHPYNLPPPDLPSTPRTTRRVMLQRELSESLRRNLLWERRVSRTNLTTLASNRQSREDLVKTGNPPIPPVRRHSEDDHGRRQAQNGVAPDAPTANTKLRRHASGGILGDALRPLTTLSSVVHLEPKLTTNGLPPTAARDQRDVKREQRRFAVARNRSWANDFHYTGW